MTRLSANDGVKDHAKPPILISESQDEYETLQSKFRDLIQPRNILEEICVSDVAQTTWEMLRLCRCKAGIVNAAYRTALKDLLRRELNIDFQTAEDLAQAWFTDEEAQKQVAEILGQFHLDETAIEAQAVRSVATELEMLDRMSMSLEVRRNRAVRSIADYRDSFAERVRGGVERIIEAEPLLRIKKPTL
jgi:hypothetical protein